MAQNGTLRRINGKFEERLTSKNNVESPCTKFTALICKVSCMRYVDIELYNKNKKVFNVA